MLPGLDINALTTQFSQQFIAQVGPQLQGIAQEAVASAKRDALVGGIALGIGTALLTYILVKKF